MPVTIHTSFASTTPAAVPEFVFDPYLWPECREILMRGPREHALCLLATMNGHFHPKFLDLYLAFTLKDPLTLYVATDMTHICLGTEPLVYDGRAITIKRKEAQVLLYWTGLRKRPRNVPPSSVSKVNRAVVTAYERATGMEMPTRRSEWGSGTRPDCSLKMTPLLVRLLNDCA